MKEMMKVGCEGSTNRVRRTTVRWEKTKVKKRKTTVRPVVKKYKVGWYDAIDMHIVDVIECACIKLTCSGKQARIIVFEIIGYILGEIVGYPIHFRVSCVCCSVRPRTHSVMSKSSSSKLTQMPQEGDA